MGAAARFFEEARPAYQTATLWTVTRTEDLQLLLGPAGTDQLFEEWRHDGVTKSKDQFPVSRITVIGNDVAVQIRLSGGAYVSRVLGASDPLVIQVGDVAYRIVYLLGGSGRRILSFDPTNRTRYNVYLVPEKGGILDRNVPLPLWKALANRVGSPNVSFTIRNEPWFYGGLGFPAVYPFAKLDLPPDGPAYVTATSAWCLAENSGLTCGSHVDGHLGDQHFTKKDLAFPIP